MWVCKQLACGPPIGAHAPSLGAHAPLTGLPPFLQGHILSFCAGLQLLSALEHTSIKNNIICLQTEENLDKLIADGKQFNKVAVIHKTGLDNHVGRFQAIAK